MRHLWLSHLLERKETYFVLFVFCYVYRGHEIFQKALYTNVKVVRFLWKYFYFISPCCFISSPEPMAQVELLWPLNVHRPSVNNLPQWHLHLNRWLDFKIISLECYFYNPLPKLLNDSASLNKMAARAKNRKSFKWYHFLGQWPDFKIIWQKCSLYDPLPKLLKSFRSAEHNCCRS